MFITKKEPDVPKVYIKTQPLLIKNYKFSFKEKPIKLLEFNTTLKKQLDNSGQFIHIKSNKTIGIAKINTESAKHLINFLIQF